MKNRCFTSWVGLCLMKVFEREVSNKHEWGQRWSSKGSSRCNRVWIYNEIQYWYLINSMTVRRSSRYGLIFLQWCDKAFLFNVGRTLGMLGSTLSINLYFLKVIAVREKFVKFKRMTEEEKVFTVLDWIGNELHFSLHIVRIFFCLLRNVLKIEWECRCL